MICNACLFVQASGTKAVEQNRFSVLNNDDTTVATGVFRAVCFAGTFVHVCA